MSNSNYQPTNPIWRDGFNKAIEINTQFKEMSQGSGGGGSGTTNYEKNYGNLEYWSWVYDLVWADDADEKVCGRPITCEDYPRYVYIFLYYGALHAVFFNQVQPFMNEYYNLEVPIDGSFPSSSVYGAVKWWNLDRLNSPNDYLIENDTSSANYHKAISSTKFHGEYDFTHSSLVLLNTNCPELFNLINSNRSLWSRCDFSKANGWWSNWGTYPTSLIDEKYIPEQFKWLAETSFWILNERQYCVFRADGTLFLFTEFEYTGYSWNSYGGINVKYCGKITAYQLDNENKTISTISSWSGDMGCSDTEQYPEHIILSTNCSGLYNAIEEYCPIGIAGIEITP